MAAQNANNAGAKGLKWHLRLLANMRFIIECDSINNNYATIMTAGFVRHCAYGFGIV